MYDRAYVGMVNSNFWQLIVRYSGLEMENLNKLSKLSMKASLVRRLRCEDTG